MTNFTINQIVKAKGESPFVIIGFRNLDGENYAQVKCVNPANLSQTSAGEFALPIAILRNYN